MNRKLSLTAALAGLAALVLAGCSSPAPTPAPTEPSPSASVPAEPTPADLLPDKYKQDGIVVVTSSGTTPPISFVDVDKPGEHFGFDPDLIRAVGEVLGVEIKFEALDFAGMIPGVQSGRFDLAMFAITDTLERQQVVDMINYIQAGVSVVVQKGNPLGIQTLDDLCGRTVAVLLSGVTAEVALEQAEKCDMTVDQYAQKSDAFMQLVQGRADASMDGTHSAQWLMDNPTDLTKDLQLVPGLEVNVSPKGIVVAKTAPELRDAVAAALNVLIDNGTYQELLDKWSLGALGLEKVLVNSATQ